MLGNQIKLKFFKIPIFQAHSCSFISHISLYINRSPKHDHFQKSMRSYHERWQTIELPKIVYNTSNTYIHKFTLVSLCAFCTGFLQIGMRNDTSIIQYAILVIYSTECWCSLFLALFLPHLPSVLLHLIPQHSEALFVRFFFLRILPNL